MLSKKSSSRFLNSRTISFLFLITSLSVILFFHSTTRASVNVTINFSSPVSTSHFLPGLTHVDNTLDYPLGNNDPTAVNSAKSLLKNAVHYENTHIMAWGVSDPWPDPSQAEPSNWSDLDGRLKLAIDTGGVPVITLSEAPWWMKGQLQQDGKTRLIKQSEEWSEVAYGARVLDNKMAAWLYLVQRVAERYMAAPYNVRYFQVWNELKGYYDPITNAYDYTINPGAPHGSNAKHGYTYMYNQVYNKLMKVATSLNIPITSVKVGGPYVVMDTLSSQERTTPSTFTKKYGTYDQRPLDVIRYWLQHKAGAGFITVDGSNVNKDFMNITNPFTASEKIADVTYWIRSLNNTIYSGAETLPIWWAEWNASPYTHTTDVNYNDAIKAYATIKFIKAGGSVFLLWGGASNYISGNGLWTTTTAGGGKPFPWYYSYKAFKTYFAPGTQIYKAAVSSPNDIEVLASANKAMIVNKTAQGINVIINGKSVSLSPYQVSLVNL